MTAQAPALSPDATTLIGLLTRQRDLYGELDGLSSQQAQLIAGGETEQLLSVLSRRQGLVEELGRINDDIGPYRGRIAEIAETLPIDYRAQLRELVEQVQAQLRQIIERDEADRQKLEAAKEGVATQLSQSVRNGAAMNAYAQRNAAQQPATVARFTDKAG